MMPAAVSRKMPVQPQSQAKYLLGGAIPCLMGLCAIGLFAALLPWSGWTILSTVAFLGYCAVLAQRAPFTLVLMLDFLFFRLTTLASGIGISMGSFMSEIGLTGQPSAAFTMLAVVYLLFTLAVALIIEKPVSNLVNKHLAGAPNLTKAFWIWPVMSLILLLCAYIFVRGGIQGFPLFTGMDRFIWRGLFDSDRLFGVFFSNRALMGILLGLIWLRSESMVRKVALGTFGVMMFMSFLIGEKFTSIVLMLIGFMLPWLLQYATTNPWRHISRFIAPAALLGTLIVVFTLPAILIAYGYLNNPDEAVDTLLGRMSGQAQLWEAVAQEDPPLLKYDSAVLNLDKRLIFRPDNEVAQVPPFAGIYNLMAAYMPFNAYNSYLIKGISLTMGFEPYILKQYGWLGMFVPLFIAAAVYAFHLIYLGFALATGNVIRLILILKLMVWVMFGLQQGDFWFIISTRNMVLIFIIIAFEIFMNTRHRQGAPKTNGS